MKLYFVTGEAANMDDFSCNLFVVEENPAAAADMMITYWAAEEVEVAVGDDGDVHVFEVPILGDVEGPARAISWNAVTNHYGVR